MILSCFFYNLSDKLIVTFMNEIKFDLTKKWTDYHLVAFDTETSGAYAIESEIIELGAVKYFQGQIIDRFQTLLKPKEFLQESSIRIHGITNEMVASAPNMSEKINQFYQFIDGSLLLAHHAPFDLGFLSYAFESHQVELPHTLNLCSSLLSRALLSTTNHKLQTLIKELKLIGGDAHRAYDDAYACFQVFEKCLLKISPEDSIKRILDIQTKDLSWHNYRILTSNNEKLASLAKQCLDKNEIEIFYLSGQTKGKKRRITPYGIVRNPDGDYINAFCHIDNQRKRFYIDKIQFDSQFSF